MSVNVHPNEGKEKKTTGKEEAPNKKSKYLDPEYKGEPLDDKLADGPVENRKCTDFICCIIFSTFIVVWFACGFWGFGNGDPQLLTYPYDISGNQCGLPAGDAEDYSYLYFPFPIVGYLDYSVCVKSCPESYDDTVECYPNDTFKDCNLRWEEVFNDPHPVYGYIKGVYPSKGYLSRLCLPDSDSVGWVKDAYEEVMGEIDVEELQKWIGDVYTAWGAIFMVAGMALGFAILYMVVMRYFVGLMVWLSILLTAATLLLLAIFCHWSSQNLYQEENQEDTRDSLEVFAYIFYALTAIFVIYVLFMCNRIRLAVAIMKAATIYIKDVWYALFVAPGMLVLTVVLYIYWSLACLYIYSSGEIVQEEQGDTIASVEWDNTTRNIFYLEFWGILWVNAFIIALEQFVLAGSVAIWYFSKGSDSGAQRPVSRPFWWAVRYHMGSLAFGSLILAVVWTIKYAFEYVKNKMKTEGMDEANIIIKWLLRCMTCYIHCFERFIKFMNRNAFIQIAINSSSFCGAARDAFFLILRNAGRFMTLGAIGNVFIFLGKWQIALASTYCGYLIITRSSLYEDELNSPLFPSIVFLLLAYVIASLFMSLYGMAVDTILHCFLLDEELCSKNSRPPQHAPEQLKSFLDKERDKESKSCGCC